MTKYTRWWDFLPLAFVACALIVLGLPAQADPAILKGANGVACQIPNNLLDPTTTQLDVTPTDIDDVEINTKLTQFGILADGACRGEDTKELAAYIGEAFPALPFVVKINNLKGKGGHYGKRVFCRMEDSDNQVYFTRKWKSLLKVEQAGLNNVKLTYKLVCLNGRTK